MFGSACKRNGSQATNRREAKVERRAVERARVMVLFVMRTRHEYVRVGRQATLSARVSMLGKSVASGTLRTLPAHGAGFIIGPILDKSEISAQSENDKLIAVNIAHIKTITRVNVLSNLHPMILNAPYINSKIAPHK